MLAIRVIPARDVFEVVRLLGLDPGSPDPGQVVRREVLDPYGLPLGKLSLEPGELLLDRVLVLAGQGIGGHLAGILHEVRGVLFLTDGLSWTARLSDLRKIVQRQNQGQITRIYTMQMRQEFLADLKTLKQEMGL
ncbi:hypothetical protein ILT44_04460 [Microvirga sp. BT689]|uniref:hypothetical protein n=1 Tax=Microvirga arvi TaxID=2778731 RepID=UPI00194E3DF2|nr:hypothetical protein [Microvirga arvi]MBM6579427.1 hypothetical protein [Microvirga arvi]